MVSAKKYRKPLLFTTKLILEKTSRIIFSTVLTVNTCRKFLIRRKTSLLKVLLLPLKVNSQQRAAMLKLESIINISWYSRASCLTKSVLYHRRLFSKYHDQIDNAVHERYIISFNNSQKTPTINSSFGSLNFKILSKQ